MDSDERGDERSDETTEIPAPVSPSDTLYSVDGRDEEGAMVRSRTVREFFRAPDEVVLHEADRDSRISSRQAPVSATQNNFFGNVTVTMAAAAKTTGKVASVSVAGLIEYLGTILGAASYALVAYGYQLVSTGEGATATLGQVLVAVGVVLVFLKHRCPQNAIDELLKMPLGQAQVKLSGLAKTTLRGKRG